MADYRLIIGNRKYSSWSMRGWLAMRLSGLAFDEILVPLDLPETSGLLAQHSPSRKVPCLVHGDRVIWDSLAIAEYMAEQAPDAGIWPAAPAVRAHARSVVAEMHSGFTALRAKFPMDMVRRHNGMLPGPAEEADIERIDILWRECLSQYGGPYLFGDWSLADCFFAPVVSRFETFGIATSAMATSYAERVRAHPHFVEWLEAARAEPWETPLEVLLGT